MSRLFASYWSKWSECENNQQSRVRTCKEGITVFPLNTFGPKCSEFELDQKRDCYISCTIQLNNLEIKLNELSNKLAMIFDEIETIGEDMDEKKCSADSLIIPLINQE